MNEEMLRVRRLARLLHLVCTIGLFALPALIMIAMLTEQLGAESLRRTYEEVTLPAEISDGTVWLVRAIESITVALTLFILWQMRSLFGFYKQGETLSARCAETILRCGQGLVAVGCVGVVTNTVVVLILTAGNPPGQRTLTVGISDGDIGFLMAGGLIVVIGWVMREAARIAEENRGFV